MALIGTGLAFKTGVFIVGAKRTAFGTYGGKLKDLTATDLGVHASQGALHHANVDPSKVNSVVWGNVIQSSVDAAYLARHIGLRSKLPIESESVTVNRLCGSGFQSLVDGAKQIILGESKIVLTGGSENMTQVPYVVRGMRFGVPLGVDLKMEDLLMHGLSDSYCKLPMAITAENLATIHNISREKVDEYALLSQTRWAEAHKAGRFKAEIQPITIHGKKGAEVFEVDEHPRPQTTLDGLAKLKPVFKKDGVVTAGNASGISDGAAAVLIASEDAVKENHLHPLARVVGWGVSGVPPEQMGIGPVPAIKIALAKTGLQLKDISLIEVNEAFSPQYLACEASLGLDRSITNTNGGAIALGHPLGASGARIVTHLVHELARTKQRYGIGSACIGGGMGISVIIENLQ